MPAIDQKTGNLDFTLSVIFSIELFFLIPIEPERKRSDVRSAAQRGAILRSFYLSRPYIKASLVRPI